MNNHGLVAHYSRCDELIATEQSAWDGVAANAEGKLIFNIEVRALRRGRSVPVLREVSSN